VSERRQSNILGGAMHRLLVIAGAAVLTLAFYLVLPLMQTISRPPVADVLLQAIDTANVPPPPPPPMEEPEQEPEPEEEPPELVEAQPLLDLSQLTLALDPHLSEGWMEGDFAVKLNTAVSASENSDALFTLAELDQQPRVIYQPSPILSRKVRKKAPGKVYVIFVVNKSGRVESPVVQTASDPVFESPALAAVKKWKFEPGKRNGRAVRFRMRVPITFPREP